MKRFFWLALFSIVTAPAWAGSPRYHPNGTALTISTAACPTGTPGLAPDGIAWGISLAGLRGYQALVCPEDGETLTGVGAIKLCLYSPTPWGPGSWTLSDFQWDLTGKTSTTDNPCRALSQLQPVVSLSDRVFLYPSTNLGVSGGTTVTIYLYGETRDVK